MPDMNEETKKRLAEIRAQHPVFAERICNECFLITLLDQAQRDTERVEELSKIRELVEFIQFETDSPLLEHTATKALRIFDDLKIASPLKSSLPKALDQAALARGGTR